MAALKAVELDPNSAEAQTSLAVFRFSYEYDWLDAERPMLRKLHRNGQVPPYSLALVYLGLGDHARALDNLEGAFAADSQFLCWLGQDAIFDPLR